MDRYKLLASAIKQARLAKGMSQEEFAEILEVSATHVKHMESGHRKPSVDILFLICENTGLSIDRILYGEKLEKEDTDINIDTLINMCTSQEKKFIIKLIEAVISMR